MTDHYRMPPDDAEPNTELARQLLARCSPLEESSAALRYITEARGLPEDSARYCAEDLRVLDAPVPGFADRLARGLVSLIRTRDNEVSAFAAEAFGIAGERVLENGRTARRTFALARNGSRDGLFRVRATGERPMVAYMIEGRLAKVLAVAAVLGNPAVYGWGGRQCLGYGVPPEPTVFVIEDARPADEQQAAAHDRDMEAGIDRLILAGKAVFRVRGPACGCCKDLDQALHHHPVAELRRHILAAEPAELSMDGWARKAARTKDPLRQAAVIKEAVELFRLRRDGMTKAFREQVRKYAGGYAGPTEDEAEPAAGQAVVFEPVLPAVEPQDGRALFDDVAAAVRRHAHASEEDVTLAVLWTVHNYRRFHGNIGTLPRLVITAGREDSGKSHLALCLSHLSEHGEVTTTPSAPNIYRAAEGDQPASFLDEVDAWYRTDTAMQEVINAGYNKGVTIRRIEDVGTGGKRQLESRRFSIFTPIALIGNDLEKVLRRTMLSRCLIIRMRSARVGDEVEDLYDNPPATAKLHALARRIKRWVQDNETSLAVAVPERPTGVINRLWTIWRPLLALANAAGGDWPARALHALEITRSRGADPGAGMQMLHDVYQILRATPGGKLHTGDLIAKLLVLELRAWSMFGKARAPVRDIDVARLLDPYELRPRQLWLAGRNRNGYTLEDATAAVARYAPSFLSETPVQPEKPSRCLGSSENPGNPRAAGLEGLPEPDADPEQFSGENQHSRGLDTQTPDSGPLEEKTPAGDPASGIPFLITAAMRERLRARGYTSEQIHELTPEQAHAALNGANGAAPAAGLTCAQCGSTFLKPDRPGPRPRFCSPACRKAARAARVTGADTSERTEELP